MMMADYESSITYWAIINGFNKNEFKLTYQDVLANYQIISYFHIVMMIQTK